MTRCCRDSINLKSSAYNQTGQSYVDQVSLHRSMCIHMRRVLLAKSVVDSRNPRYTRVMQQRHCRPSSCKLRFSEECPSSETIDKLAYDTEHHPFDIIRVHLRSKSASKERSCSVDRQRAANDANCPCARPSTAKDRSPSTKSNLKSTRKSEDLVHCRQLQSRKKEINYHDKRQFSNAKSSAISPCRVNKFRRKCKQNACRGNCGASESSSSDERSYSATNATSRGETSRRWSMDEEADRRQEETFRKLAGREEEEARYAKFIYDVTQEIVQNGLYTDRELKEVFEKHLERNSGRLSKRKMLYEIYQLKISLNMVDDDEDEDEVEADLVFAEKFAQHRVPKPPTPPKILNENKVIEKLESFKQQQENSRSFTPSSPARRSVVLVDPNPEFLVTERDVLSTLMDNDVDPEQIQRIYKNLCRKSKDMSLCEAVQVGSEIAYTHRLKQIDRSTSATSLNSNYAKDKSHGILRKESTDFTSKLLLPETSYHKYLKSKHNEAFEKCEKWNAGQCPCKTQPCLQHTQPTEREKRSSLPKTPNKKEKTEDMPQKIESPENKKITFTEKAKIIEPSQLSSKQESSIKEITPEMSRSSDLSEMTKDEKREATSAMASPVSKVEVAYTGRSALSEDNEEIEEEIESVMDDLPARENEEKREEEDEEEEKELSSVQEEDEEAISTGSDSYSDDFSNVSDSSSKNMQSSSPKSKPKYPKNRRYSTTRDYLENFSTVDDQRVWRISEGSSDSTSSLSIIGAQSGSRVNDSGSKPATQTSGAVKPKKRTSSGTSGFRLMDSWNERVSELSSDFYLNSAARYCDPNCRAGPNAKSCSDNCKFVRTNCRNLSNPTDCLNRVKEESDSSESSVSS